MAKRQRIGHWFIARAVWSVKLRELRCDKGKWAGRIVDCRLWYGISYVQNTRTHQVLRELPCPACRSHPADCWLSLMTCSCGLGCNDRECQAVLVSQQGQEGKYEHVAPIPGCGSGERPRWLRRRAYRRAAKSSMLRFYAYDVMTADL
jgi:hypothetical protein